MKSKININRKHWHKWH